jgi:hypothetical protein
MYEGANLPACGSVLRRMTTHYCHNPAVALDCSVDDRQRQVCLQVMESVRIQDCDHTTFYGLKDSTDSFLRARRQPSAPGALSEDALDGSSCQ